MMNSAAMLGILEEAGVSVMTLAETLTEEEFLASRLTKAEVIRHLVIMAETADNLPADVRYLMPEIDWGAWSALGAQLSGQRKDDQDVLWFGVSSLAPAILLWLRIYRTNQPDLFDFKP